jgi:hypothetical protein
MGKCMFCDSAFTYSQEMPNFDIIIWSQLEIYETHNDKGLSG